MCYDYIDLFMNNLSAVIGAFIYLFHLFVCFFVFSRVAVSRSKDVPPFGPNIPAGAKFGKQKAFADFLLTKGEECSSFYRN